MVIRRAEYKDIDEIIQVKRHKGKGQEIQPHNEQDTKSKDYGELAYKARPGHADLAGGMKYNHKDLRNV